MKESILKFKDIIKYSVSTIASREFAFIYCTIGTIAQISHTYYLINNISSLDGNFKVLQALMLSIFISSSLLYFTAISDNSETKESRKIHFAVTLFTIIEILINIYYYSRHLLIDNLDNITLNFIFDFIFAVIISCLIPITIKLYSSHIRAKEWLDELFLDKNDVNNEFELLTSMNDIKIKELENKLHNVNITLTNLLESDVNDDVNLDEIVKVKDDIINELTTLSNNIKGDIKESFEKDSQLFLTQFSNKVKSVMNKVNNEN